jgi:hypothetical protein
MYRYLITLIVLSLPVAVPATDGLEERSALDARWQAGAWEQRATRLDALARSDIAGFDSELRAVLATQSTEPAMEDRLLQQAALSLLAAPRTIEGRELLDRLSGLAPRAMTIHEDAGHRIPIPYADPGAAARAVSRAWDRFDARDSTLLALASGTDALATLHTGSGIEEDRRRGMELAFDAAPLSQIAGQREGIRSALRADPTLTGIATRVALRTADVGLARDVIERGDGRAQLELVLGLRGSMQAADATGLLIEATADARIASAAVLELGQQAATSGAARDELMGLLADPDMGGSAAQALALNMTPATLADLGAVLDRGLDDLTTRRAILSLRLSDAPAADAMLNDFVIGSHAPEALRQEVAAWIGE